MKIDDLIAQLQKISDQRGNPEIVLRDSNDWRRHDANLRVKDLGYCIGVHHNSGFIPQDVIDNPRGFKSEYAAQLKRKKVTQVLLINI